MQGIQNPCPAVCSPVVIACTAPHRFARALIVEDLDEPREWLAELLPLALPAVVIVATIHDDDAHVFPALRAGAAGYILKSQQAALVKAQLQRLELGEPALSPSIALRVLQHFRALGLPAAPAGPAAAHPGLPPPGDHAPDRA